MAAQPHRPLCFIRLLRCAACAGLPLMRKRRLNPLTKFAKKISGPSEHPCAGAQGAPRACWAALPPHPHRVGGTRIRSFRRLAGLGPRAALPTVPRFGRTCATPGKIIFRGGGLWPCGRCAASGRTRGGSRNRWPWEVSCKKGRCKPSPVKPRIAATWRQLFSENHKGHQEWEISSPRAVVHSTMEGQRAGRADRTPGRCQVGRIDNPSYALGRCATGAPARG